MDRGLIGLISVIDAYTKKHEKSRLSAFVAFLTDDKESIRPKIAELAKERRLTIPLVIPKDSKNGPPAFKLNPKVKYTILLYREKSVKANLAVDSIDLDTVMKVIESAEKML